MIGVKQANADAADTIMMQTKSGTEIPAASEEAGTLFRHLQSDEGCDFLLRSETN